MCWLLITSGKRLRWSTKAVVGATLVIHADRYIVMKLTIAMNRIPLSSAGR